MQPDLFSENANGLKIAHNAIRGQKQSKVVTLDPVQQEKKALFTQFVKLFFDTYKERTGIQYSFTGKEQKSLQGIVTQLYNIAPDKTNIFGIFETILKRWDTLPAWYGQNFTLAIINSKLNEILNVLKNGKRTTANTGNTSPSSAAFNNALDKLYSKRR